MINKQRFSEHNPLKKYLLNSHPSYLPCEKTIYFTGTASSTCTQLESAKVALLDLDMQSISLEHEPITQLNLLQMGFHPAVQSFLHLGVNLKLMTRWICPKEQHQNNYKKHGFEGSQFVTCSFVKSSLTLWRVSKQFFSHTNGKRPLPRLQNVVHHVDPEATQATKRPHDRPPRVCS